MARSQKRVYESWLMDLTSVPTAAGREHRVHAWIDEWIALRLDRIEVRRDDSGNVLILRADRKTSRAKSLLITAHLDHPAFVVTGVQSDGMIELEFRGGVLDGYFKRASIRIIDGADHEYRATIQSIDSKSKPFKTARARLAGTGAKRADAVKLIVAGDIARWDLPRATISSTRLPPLPGTTKSRTERCLHTHACDDLAAAAAALAAMDQTLDDPAFAHVGLLFTVAEEVGFIGAIRSATSRFIPRGARLLNLETSRSFPHDSPIGAGAILRVGDRLTVFPSPFTNAIGEALRLHAVRAKNFRWQRKLMVGGACESTAFAAFGWECTCLCLPLGNYHNMGNLAEVQQGRGRATIAREFISMNDFHNFIEMLVVTTRALAKPLVFDLRPLMKKLNAENGVVLGAPRSGRLGRKP
ncbi:MAG: hypothetical protein O2800_06570 [Planctomycetota bacterium]|nr:hypothetical protein [Planctomycetota bacterium]